MRSWFCHRAAYVCVLRYKLYPVKRPSNGLRPRPRWTHDSSHTRGFDASYDLDRHGDRALRTVEAIGLLSTPA